MKSLRVKKKNLEFLSIAVKETDAEKHTRRLQGEFSQMVEI